MRKWTKTVGLLFWAAASVYNDRAIAVEPVSAVGPSASEQASGGVKLLDDATDPFASPSTNPSATSQPAPSEGKSVSASEVNVSEAGTVEIHVNDASLIEVLRMMSLQSQRNIVASKEVRGTVTANLYDVTVREALDAILHANGYAYREKGNFIYVYTVKELEAQEKAERKTTTEVFHVYYTPASNAVTMIKPVLSGEAQVSFTTPAVSGLETGAKDVGGNSHATDDVIVVTDYADNLEAARKILKEVDRRPQQILIEATILRAALSEDNALGVDFTVVGGVDFSTLTAPNGLIQGAQLGGNTFNNSAASGGTGNNFSSGVPNGLKLGFVSNNVSIFLSALEGVTDTTVLANPKVLALNKQKGEVIVGRKDGYITTTVTETSQVQTVEFLDTGTRLIFRPFIADDGFIRMEIHPEDSSGGLTANNPPLPFKITTEVTSNVMIKDGHTIVIGGLFREEATVSKSQIPFLGSLPLAGPLFRQERDTQKREEIIILLTPHIVKDEAVMSAQAEQMMRDGDKLRAGVRRGMMPWGRERMAEAAYDTAVAEMNKPNPDRKKALWHLDCAMNLSPLFLDAMRMKEQLTGREMQTALDNSLIRNFVRRQILDDRLPATQPSAEPSKLPATQPVAVTGATTQPAVALAPATQPVAEVQETNVVVAEVPSTQPAQAEAIEEKHEGVAVVNVIDVSSPTTAPTTAPAVQTVEKPEDASSVTVTELPLDPAAETQDAPSPFKGGESFDK